jgi:hypothetical protein
MAALITVELLAEALGTSPHWAAATTTRATRSQSQ